MKVQSLTAAALTPEQLAAWSRIQQQDPALDSPFFRPEFTLSVAAVRADVEVAVLSSAAEAVGFLPYHRTRGGVGRPVGMDLSDVQGLIARPEVACDAEQLLRSCGLIAWHFTSVVAAQPCFQPYHCLVWQSPYMDLGEGFAAYRRERQACGCRTIVEIERKRRKLEREIGPLRLVPHVSERRALEILLDWKIRQYRRTKARNYLAPSWTVALLDRVRNLQCADFAGMLSVLYVGDRPAALHLGLRSGGVLHVWFPVHDPDLGKYSPGLILWWELAHSAEGLGIRRIDFGRGGERYKASLQSGAMRLAEGSIDLRPVASYLRRGWLHTREALRASPLRVPGQTVLRYARTWFGRHET
jgi:CelD/BcsL family acetyltransferase involved in cellulose biosynthesis